MESTNDDGAVLDPATLITNRVQVALAVNHFLALPAEQRTEWVNAVLADERAVEQVDTDIEVILEMLGYSIDQEPVIEPAVELGIGGYL